MLARLAIVLLTLLISVPGQRMLCVESTREVHELDVATGAKSLVGRLSANVGTASGFAFDLSKGDLYVTSTSNDALYLVDMSDWHAVLVGPYGAGVNLMTGIEWDFFSSTLFGVDALGAFYEVDVSTGAATRISSLPFGASSLGFDPFANTMYLADVATDCLYTVDRGTGATALLGPLQGSISPSCMAYDVGRATMYLCDNVTDNLYSVDTTTGAVTVVGAMGPGNVLGMAYVPGDGRLSREEVGCGAATMFASGYADRGGAVEFTIENLSGIGLVGFGLTSTSTPLCGCVLGHEWAVAEVGPVVRFEIPNLTGVVGMQVRVQGADLFGASACAALPVTLTDTVIVEIGG